MIKKNNKLKNYTWDISCLGTFDEETKSTSVYNYLYTYKKNDGNGKIIVAFNNTRKPVRDYYFESSTSNYSKIKNKDILIYHMKIHIIQNLKIMVFITILKVTM